MRVAREPIRPHLVVVAHDRPAALARLLRSLGRASYPSAEVGLTVSLDPSARSGEIAAAVEGFEWGHGKKTLVERPRRLGLRRHVLACGDLAREHGAVVLLEEDVTVSPAFYDYLESTVGAYADEPEVAGVSLCLYDTHPFGFVENLTPLFTPLDDGADVWFARYAPSWGQCVTAAQWGAFRSWLDRRDPMGGTAALRRVPRAVRSWPEDSWKKLFIEYLVDRERYFVFPRVALSVHWGDAGRHMALDTGRFQVPLRASPPGRVSATALGASRARYDAHLEIEGRCLAEFDPSLAELDFECDLYGVKEAGELRSPLVLTARPGERALRRWGADMTPPELNVALGMEGSGLRLAPARDAIPRDARRPVPVAPRYAFSRRDPFGDPELGMARLGAAARELEERG